jgi:hypothetical protein
MSFAFPVVGDPVEVCLDGLRGERFVVRGVFMEHGRAAVVIHTACTLPGCTDNHDLSVWADDVRPHLSA